MKDVLIINLTRMGDLIQTTPVMAGLKHNYPDVRITLLANPAFSEICQYIPFLDRLLILEIDKIVDGIDHIDFITTFRYIQGILDKINKTRYDLVANFTHTASSAILTSLINAKRISGLSIDSQGHSVKFNPWIRYFFNVIPGRTYNPFHLCDVYIMAGGAISKEKGLHLCVPYDIEEWVKTALYKKGVADKDLVIGLQLGASAEDKRWPVSSFADLANKLVANFGAKIILTGSSKEIEYGKEFEALSRVNPLNFIGKTDLKELTALLKRCNLFITNDTGPLHIATAVGTTCIDISLASVHFKETGPYGDGHYVIQADIPCCPCSFATTCKDMICKKMISVSSVFELAKNIIEKKEITNIVDSSLWKNIQVYRSYFDRDGLIEYRPLIRRPLKKEILFRYIYKATWLNLLYKKKCRDLPDIIRNIIEKLLNYYIIDTDLLHDIVHDEVAILIKLQSIATVALSKVKLIKKEAQRPSPDYSWIKDTWKIVPDIDREIERLGRIHPTVKPLSTFFRYGKERLKDKDLVALSQDTSHLYEQLINHISMLIEILQGIGKHFSDKQL